MKASWLAAIPIVAAFTLILAGCASAPSIAGTWAASDGTNAKLINADGTCSGTYYNGSAPLDICGAESCVLSSTSTNGTYTMVVRQAPNQQTFDVTFAGSTMTLSLGGSTIVTVTKR